MSNFNTITTMSTINLNKLTIGFGSTYERIEPNTFTITGDITIQASQGAQHITISVDKLTIVYNNDGLLDYINKSEHMSLDLFYDAEHCFIAQEMDWDADTHGYKFETDGNSIELYADFEIYGDDVY